MDSSSDEDMEVYANICHPNTSDLWQKRKPFPVEQIESVNGESSPSNDAIIQNIIDNFTRAQEGFCRIPQFSNLQKATRTSKDDNQENTYFTRKFTKLSKSNRIVEDEEEEICPSINTDESTSFLLNGIPVQEENLNSNKEKRRRKCLNFDPNCESYHTEDELIRKCKSVALSVDDILTSKHDYPHPHPKNIRYLDSFILVSKSSDGIIRGRKGDYDKKPKSKIKKSKTDKIEEPNKKVQNGGENLEPKNKKRKQLRKRGPKKKKVSRE